MQEHINLHDIVEIEIKRMGINGEGIGYYQRLAIFIDDALPGEKVLAQISEVYANRAHAKVLKRLSDSPLRTQPNCPVYDACGGCQVQHVEYDAMLDQKQDIILKALDRYVKRYDRTVIDKTIGMDNPNNYRNKASLPLRKINGKNRFGMYGRNSHEFVPIKTCGVQHTKINDVFLTVTKLMDALQIDAYDPDTKSGVISHLVVRIAENTDEIQVSFILPKAYDKIHLIVDELTKIHPEVVSVYQVVQPDIRYSFFNEQMELIYGKEEIELSLGGHSFHLTPDTFFQLNTTQAHKFYEQMKKLSNLQASDIVVEAYAGIAPISHFIGNDAKHIYAIEYQSSKAQSAIKSLKENNIDNVTVIEDHFESAMNKFQIESVDVMLFDAPRSGLTPSTIETILKYEPQRIVYGSCNPSTLAKDLNLLLEKYTLKKIVPIDMFPYTSLVESISLLELKTAL